MAGISAETFWTWDKTDTTGYYGHPLLALDKCFNFDKEIWLELGKFMWRNHRIVYQDHMKYICNDILKPFRFKIIRYADRVREIHELDKCPPTPLMKGKSTESDSWTVRNQESALNFNQNFNDREFLVAYSPTI